MKMPRGIEARAGKVEDLQGAGMGQVNFFELGFHCAMRFKKAGGMEWERQTNA
jgi:hypothetical protein